MRRGTVESSNYNESTVTVFASEFKDQPRAEA